MELIRELGLNVIAVGLVTPELGGARSVVKWINTLEIEHHTSLS